MRISHTFVPSVVTKPEPKARDAMVATWNTAFKLGKGDEAWDWHASSADGQVIITASRESYGPYAMTHESPPGDLTHLISGKDLDVAVAQALEIRREQWLRLEAATSERVVQGTLEELAVGPAGVGHLKARLRWLPKTLPEAAGVQVQVESRGWNIRAPWPGQPGVWDQIHSYIREAQACAVTYACAGESEEEDRSYLLWAAIGTTLLLASGLTALIALTWWSALATAAFGFSAAGLGLYLLMPSRRKSGPGLLWLALGVFLVFGGIYGSLIETGDLAPEASDAMLIKALLTSAGVTAGGSTFALDPATRLADLVIYTHLMLVLATAGGVLYAAYTRIMRAIRWRIPDQRQG